MSSHSRQPPDFTLEPDVLRDTNGLVSFCIMLEFDSKFIYLDLVLVVSQDTSKCIYSEYRKSPILIGALHSIQIEGDILNSLMSCLRCTQAFRSNPRRLGMEIAGKIIVPCISPNLTFQSGDAAVISGICGERESVIESCRL